MLLTFFLIPHFLLESKARISFRECPFPHGFSWTCFTLMWGLKHGTYFVCNTSETGFLTVSGTYRVGWSGWPISHGHLFSTASCPALPLDYNHIPLYPGFILLCRIEFFLGGENTVYIFFVFSCAPNKWNY